MRGAINAFSLIGGYGGQLATGLGLTLAVALTSFTLSLALGLLLSTALFSRHRVIAWLWRIYASAAMGVPSILVIFVFYYNGSTFLSLLLRGFQVTNFDISPFDAATFGLVVVYTSYVAEVFRGAFANVARGQWEAGHSLGLRGTMIFLLIVFPQALRLALPGLSNILLVISKDTALVSLVGLTDIVRVADTASGTTKEPFIFYVIAGLAFVLIGGVTTAVSGRLETRLTRHLSTFRGR